MALYLKQNFSVTAVGCYAALDSCHCVLTSFVDFRLKMFRQWPLI